MPMDWARRSRAARVGLTALPTCFAHPADRAWLRATRGLGLNRNAFVIASIAGIFSMSAAIAAQAEGLRYKAPASWVLDPPTSADSSMSTDALVRFTYLDNQVRISPEGVDQEYTAYRIKIMKPEGLAAGNLTLTWQPESGGMTVHYVRLIRNRQTTDVLASTKFIVVQREAQLEQSILTGLRTATLQVPGLQVGDELAVAVTIDKRDVGFDGRVANLMQLPLAGTPGAYRFRLSWPSARPLEWRISRDMPPIDATTAGGLTTLDVTLRDPPGPMPTEGAPARYNVRRLIEYSDFGAWPDVSRQLAPMFERAASLRAGSPIKAEAATIAARTKDPAERAEAALQLVEDRIRYVFIALNGGGYIPATADETWERRFGDCKAKAALLVALLRELGIEAQPALVNSHGGDGLDERLPGPRVFDHVITRAVLSGKVVWLDATRVGDRHLDNLPSPYRWALPLNASGAALEKIPPHDGGFPDLIEIVDVDATAGIDHDAHARLRNILRGDEAFAIRTQLASLTAEDADRALKTYWRGQADWVTPDKVSWSYDERRHAVSLELVGDGNPGWKDYAEKGHSLTITHAGFYAPDPLRRPKNQDQAAPWLVDFPHFRCSATTIHLPKAGGKFGWSLYAEPMNEWLGGFIYWRNSGLSGNIVRTVMSTHTYEPEATPAEAEIVNSAIPNFNNNMSSISEELPANIIKTVSSTLPFDDSVDWLNAPTPCSPAPEPSVWVLDRDR